MLSSLKIYFPKLIDWRIDVRILFAVQTPLLLELAPLPEIILLLISLEIFDLSNRFDSLFRSFGYEQ